MYYSNTHRKTETNHRLTAFFIISIFLFTFPAKNFAEVLDKTAEEYHQKGYDAQQNGDFEHALNYYSKALSLGLRDARLYNDIGILYEQLGARERASGYYFEAIKIDPDYLPVYTNLAYSYLEQGDTQKAIKYFRQRLKRSAADDPWRDKIKQELYRIDPKYQVRQEAQDAEALKAELEAKAREKFNLQLVRAQKHYQQGQAFFNEGKFNEATEEFDRALSVTPNNPKILRARKEAVFQSHVDNVSKRTNSAIEKLKSKDVDSARKQFEDIITNFPSE